MVGGKKMNVDLNQAREIFSKADNVLNTYGLSADDINTLWENVDNPHLRFALKQTYLKKKIEEGVEDANEDIQDKMVEEFLEELEEYEGMDF